MTFNLNRLSFCGLQVRVFWNMHHSLPTLETKRLTACHAYIIHILHCMDGMDIKRALRDAQVIKPFICAVSLYGKQNTWLY